MDFPYPESEPEDIKTKDDDYVDQYITNIKSTLNKDKELYKKLLRHEYTYIQQKYIKIVSNHYDETLKKYYDFLVEHSAKTGAEIFDEMINNFNIMD